MEVFPIFSTAVLFSIWTCVCCMAKYLMADSSYPPDKTMSKTIMVCYVVIAFIGQLTINLLNTKALCAGSVQPFGAFIHTFIPNLLIFIAIAVIINQRPGWLIPFSNTLGY